ncbi:MAG: nitroreductase [Candidatus Hydrogenedentota bacterium]
MANKTPTGIAAAYHAATKHQPHRPARSPGHMDWANQPNPFRRYTGAPLLRLPFLPEDDTPAYDALYTAGAVSPRPLNAHTLGGFFEMSLALSAWKEYRGARWELRCNPSSGNLHPTEGYLVCGAIPGLTEEPGVYHYAPQEHGIERRALIPGDAWALLRRGFPAPTFFAGLSSIWWRETWKYGERAYRYCHHDVGHAFAAFSFAGAALGWRVILLDALADADVAAILGLDRASDYENAEPEHPALLAAVVPVTHEAPVPGTLAHGAVSALAAAAAWTGQANRLSTDHIDWPLIDEAGAASIKPVTKAPPYAPLPQAAHTGGISAPPTARSIIVQRRSAVAMDGETGCDSATFFTMLARTLPDTHKPPWYGLPPMPHAHLLIFVHRVSGIERGLYLLVRGSDAAPVQAALHPDFAWATVPEAAALPLYLLKPGDFRSTAAQVSCQQVIAGDSAFSLGMLAPFAGPLQEDGAWRYPRLFWETGAVGQVLYLEAERHGLRATGIGCFFDDLVHGIVGIDAPALQSLYHFTIGGPVEDGRLRSLPPYSAERKLQPGGFATGQHTDTIYPKGV